MQNTGVQPVPNSSGTEPPKLEAPRTAADCHIHIYDPRFQPPVAKPSNATAGHYRLWQKRIGTTRVVIVQPRNYATDASVTLDAISQLGLANARGVAVVRPAVTDGELVWGSNWPHPGPKVPPDDAVVFDLLATWAPDEATRRRILVSNPETLYGFPKEA